MSSYPRRSYQEFLANFESRRRARATSTSNHHRHFEASHQPAGNLQGGSVGERPAGQHGRTDGPVVRSASLDGISTRRDNRETHGHATRQSTAPIPAHWYPPRRSSATMPIRTGSGNNSGSSHAARSNDNLNISVTPPMARSRTTSSSGSVNNLSDGELSPRATVNTEEVEKMADYYAQKRRDRKQRELADKISQYAPLDDIRVLLATGAEVNGAVTQGLHPLHYAVYANNAPCVQLLLIRGANPAAKDDIGYTPVHLAAEHGSYDLLASLLRYECPVNFSNPAMEQSEYPVAYKSEEPLRLAIRNGHYECARLLLENSADPNARYFYGSEITMVPVNETIFIRLLLMYGADPNTYSRDGLTPLMRACQKGDACADTVATLLEFGALPTALATERQDLRMPLHYAVLSGSVRVVNMLLQSKASASMPESYDRASPLDVAVFSDNVAMVRLLLEAGASPNKYYTYIGSPLHLACGSPDLNHQKELIETLLEFGADPNLVAIFEQGGYLRSPLAEYLRASEKPDGEVVRTLLSYGGEVSLRVNVTSGGQHRHVPLPGVVPLNDVARLHSRDRGLYNLLMESASVVERIAVRRSTLPPAERLRLLDRASNPLSLLKQSRIALRRQLHPLSRDKVLPLPIPDVLKEVVLGTRPPINRMGEQPVGEWGDTW